MDKIKLKGFPVQLIDDVTEPGVVVADITMVDKDLNEISLHDIEAKVKVIITSPSLDTSICQAEARKFNVEVGSREGVKGVFVTNDLPFASKRFCETEGIKNITTLSDFRYGDLGKELGVEMVDGALKGLLARTVFVLDQNNKVVLTEVTSDILEEPDYDKVIAKVDELLA